MVADRRFGPLIALVGLALFVLLARLWQVQVVEHEIWAAEAANLTRKASIDPYLRGPITDRDGEAFVRDVPAASIRFVYREFRREHCLGQVAHARSALEHRSVSLHEAVENLERWAFELLDSRPRDFERFEEGEALHFAGVGHPLAPEVGARRYSRASNLRFYVHGLLDVEDSEWRAIKKRTEERAGRELTWLELGAEVQGLSPARKREDLARGFDVSLGRLEQLASELEVSGPAGEPAISSAQSFAFLVDALEAKRRDVEDAILVDLFRAGAGFHPGRLEPELLLACFDLQRSAATLGWDRARVERWAFTTRETWLENWRTFHVPAALIRADLERRGGAAPLEALVGELSLLFAPRPNTARERRAQRRAWHAWRERDEVVVFAELETLFEEVEPGPATGAPVPSLEEELRAEWLDLDELPAALVPFEFAPEVAAARPPRERLDWRGELLEPWRAPTSRAEAERRLVTLLRWRGRGAGGSAVPTPRPAHLDGDELLPWIAELWQAQFQERLLARLEGARDEDSGEPVAWPRPLTSDRRKNAEQVSDYAIRDRSSRPETLHDDPEEEVMNLLLRFRDDYGGFSILPRTQRLFLALDEDDVPVARDLIGVVRESTLEEVIDQRTERSALSSIMRQRVISAEDEVRIDALVEQIYRNDEVHGTSGVEALCDSALRGVNGFRLHMGLQEREEAGRSPVDKRKIDGLEVRLTLDLELQKAAQYTIEHPVLPSGEALRDGVWFENPVGAIVLATVDGEVLAAASGPKEPAEPVPHRDAERSYAYDRCFHRRQFQPIGSIFKPFVAAWALDRLGLDTDTVLSCEVRPELGRAGWGKVSCNARYGHHDVTLVPAIESSCNAYFAQLGERFETKERFARMARAFGFDRPTGVRDAWDGRGFGEDVQIPVFHSGRDFTDTQLHRGANGLEVLEAAPAQVARAVAGLATGRLPALRIVRSIGGERVPARYEELPLSAEALRVVREAMRGVVRRGSASGKGLSSELLGFDLAGKTGSADYLPMSDAYRAQLRVPSGRSPDMRKHTWFMGFFPAEEPRAVVVVYLHDIGVTASHSAVHVAAQFLKSPALQAWYREDGP